MAAAPEFAWQLATAATTLGFGASAIAAWWQHRNARREASDRAREVASHRLTRDQFEVLRRELELRRRAVEKLEAERESGVRQAQETERELVRLRSQVSLAQTQLKDDEARAIDAQQKLQALQQQSQRATAEAAGLGVKLKEATTRAQAAERSLQSARQSLSEAQARLASTSRALASLGVPEAGDDVDPLAIDRRTATRGALVDLWAGGDVRAAAVVDRRGLALLGAGPDGSIDDLGTLGAMVDLAVPALEHVLGGRLSLVSVSSQQDGRHLLALEEGRWLAAEGPSNAPAVALRLTALRIAGARPVPSPRVPHGVGTVPVPRNERLAEIYGALADWSSRRGAEAVALVGAEGTVLSASSVEAGAMLGEVRKALQPLVLRLERDGHDLELVEFVVRAEDGATLGVRLLGTHANALTLAAVLPAAATLDAFDELADTLRWLARQDADAIAA